MNRGSKTDLEVSTRLGLCGTKVETSFAFGNEMDTGVSGTIPAWTAADRSFACCGPPHPLGWVNTNSMDSEIEFHLTSPPGSDDLNSALAESKRQRMKSAYTSMIMGALCSSDLIRRQVAHWERVIFHLASISVLARGTEHNLSPFHLEKGIAVLEVTPVLNSMRFPVVIVI